MKKLNLQTLCNGLRLNFYSIPVLIPGIVMLFSSLGSISAQHNYAKALHISTRFLGAQRSGNTQSWILPENTAGAFTSDGEAVGCDLSGGWNDCGDYIKFHVTGSYAALLYLYGYDKWPEAYADNYSPAYSKGPSNGIPDVLDEVKIQTDFLIKCASADGIIYWQVANEKDHNNFFEPITQSKRKLYNNSTLRPVYTASEGHSNALGAGSAALALMSVLYQPYDAQYAATCRSAAIKYFDIASINPSTSNDATSSSYDWLKKYSDYYDEMGSAAALLYRATGETKYLDKAEQYAEKASAYRDFMYGNIDYILFYELYKITGSAKYLNKIKTRVDYNHTKMTPCGYIHLTNWGSLRDAGNAALLAALYHKETGDAKAYSFAKRNIDFILGTHDFISADAPANFSFLIGYNELGGGYPKYPHHAAAFGKSTNDWTLFTNEGKKPGSVPYAYELTGALAGGPEEPCAKFTDNITNYVSSEYCIYYNAAFNSAVAYLHKVEEHTSTNVEKVENVQNINVFPIPAQNGQFSITLDGSATLALAGIDGKEIWSGHVYRHQVVNIEKSGKGVYVLFDKNSGWSRKIVLQ